MIKENILIVSISSKGALFLAEYSLSRAELLRIFPLLSRIGDVRLTEQIIAVWQDAFADCLWPRLEDACFNPEAHPFRLVDHINAATQGALAVAQAMEEYQGIVLDHDRIIALGYLHDVSKILEFEPGPDGTPRKSEIGRLIQHGAMGAFYARKHGMALEYIHLILTHTPQSKMAPVYKEAWLFSHIDLADAQIVDSFHEA